MKLTFVSGKGGVGKTTISLALALRAAGRGERILLAEANSEEQVARLLGRPPTGPVEKGLLPNLCGINIRPDRSFEEYVLLQLRSKLLYRAVFENRFVRNFIEATPGLADLMIVGKIYSLIDRYDRIIVDAPATGHGLALLQIAGIVASAVRIGPLQTHASAIDGIVRDPAKTEIVIVTLPEEMPAAEAVEMGEKLGKEGLPLARVVLNQAVAPPLSRREQEEFERLAEPGRDDPVFQAMKLELARAARSALYRRRLETAFKKIPLAAVPFVPSPDFGLKEVEKIAAAL